MVIAYYFLLLFWVARYSGGVTLEGSILYKKIAIFNQYNVLSRKLGFRH